jgi:hypothetical protein
MATPWQAVGDNPTLRTGALAVGALALGAVGGLALAAGNPLIPFLALAALVPVPWLITRPQADLWLAGAVIALLPFGTLPVKVGITPTFLEIALLLLAVTSLFAGVRAADPPWRGLARTPLDGWVLAFLGVISFAFVLGLSRDHDVTIAHNFVKLVLAISLFFTAGQVLRTTEAITRLLRVLTLGGGLAATVGLVLWRLPDDLATRLLLYLRPVGYPTDRVLRYVESGPALGQERTIGTSVDPNSFGGLLVVLVALTLAQVLSKRPVLPRWLLVPILGADGLALLLTQSRAAWAGAGAAALLIGVLRYRRFAAALVAAGLIVLASGLGGKYVDRFISGIQLQDQAQLMRVAEFQNAGTIIARYPAFGVGFGQAGDLDLTTGVSSVYLTLAERTGLLGLAAFAAQMIAFFVLLAPWLRRPPQVEAIAPAAEDPDHGPQTTDHAAQLDTALLGSAAAVFGALTVGVADHYYFNIEQSHLAALLWLCLAVGLAARRELINL